MGEGKETKTSILQERDHHKKGAVSPSPPLRRLRRRRKRKRGRFIYHGEDRGRITLPREKREEDPSFNRRGDGIETLILAREGGGGGEGISALTGVLSFSGRTREGGPR